MVFERYLQLYDLRNFILANLFKFLLIPGAEFPSSSVRNNLLISDDIDGFHPWNRFQNRNIRLIWAFLRFFAFRPKTMLMVWIKPFDRVKIGYTRTDLGLQRTNRLDCNLVENSDKTCEASASEFHLTNFGPFKFNPWTITAINVIILRNIFFSFRYRRLQ